MHILELASVPSLTAFPRNEATQQTDNGHGSGLSDCPSKGHSPFPPSGVMKILEEITFSAPPSSGCHSDEGEQPNDQ